MKQQKKFGRKRNKVNRVREKRVDGFLARDLLSTKGRRAKEVVQLEEKMKEDSNLKPSLELYNSMVASFHSLLDFNPELYGSSPLFDDIFGLLLLLLFWVFDLAVSFGLLCNFFFG